MQYPPVEASGVDANTIHYGRNDKLLRAGELLLMDAGCELHGYASDVTRTWPISGTFTAAQAHIYDIVLDVHRYALRIACSTRVLNTLATPERCQRSVARCSTRA